MVQVREESNWDQDGSGACSEKWSNSEHIFRRQFTEFPD